MVRHFPILENSETELSVDPRNGRRNNTTHSALRATAYKSFMLIRAFTLAPHIGSYKHTCTVLHFNCCFFRETWHKARNLANGSFLSLRL